MLYFRRVGCVMWGCSGRDGGVVQGSAGRGRGCHRSGKWRLVQLALYSTRTQVSGWEDLMILSIIFFYCPERKRLFSFPLDSGAFTKPSGLRNCCGGTKFSYALRVICLGVHWVIQSRNYSIVQGKSSYIKQIPFLRIPLYIYCLPASKKG